MGKSLTETAKDILMKESNDPTPDRDAKSMTPNKATLRPASRGPEARFSNPGASTEAEFDQYEDLGPALVNNTDIPPSAKAAAKMGKDTSKSSQSSVPAEKPKQQAEVMEEEYEISEELEQFIQDMVAEGYSEDEIAQAIEENFEIVSEEKEEDEDEDKEDKKEKNEKMMKEHVDALLAGENLSEEFRAKAEAIFESAVSTRLQEELQVIEEAYSATLQEEVENIREELTTQIDDYLNYVVEQWVSENEVAIESGLRSELTEEFIGGLRNLFAEHYIDIPEDKVDIVEELGSKVSELQTKLNEEIERNVILSRDINEAKQIEIVSEACEGLTDIQSEKLKTLAENIVFKNVDEFKQKLNIIKESYFSKPVSNQKNLDSVENADGRSIITEELHGPMAQYVKVLGKTTQR